MSPTCDLRPTSTSRTTGSPAKRSSRSISRTPAPTCHFSLGDIRVGVELEIRGLLNEGTGELKAKSIKVDLEQFKSIKQTAFVSRAPKGIQLLDGNWAGEL